MKRYWFVAAILVLMLGVVAISYAATDFDTVVVTAKASPAIELTLDTNAITLLDLLPGASDSDPVTISVRSNKAYKLFRAVTDNTPAAFNVTGTGVAGAAGVDYARTAGDGTPRDHADTLTGTMTWGADGDSTYTSDVLYTATTQ